MSPIGTSRTCQRVRRMSRYWGKSGSDVLSLSPTSNMQKKPRINRSARNDFPGPRMIPRKFLAVARGDRPS